MSWIEYSKETEFPIQNLPYGVFKTTGTSPRCGVAIGDYVLDLAQLTDANYFSGTQVETTKCFHEGTLNKFMGLGKSVWSQTRQILTKILSLDDSSLKNNTELRSKALIPQKEVEMLLPANIGDYTDFYASKEHASNIGTMWRGKENALMPNWLWIPIGYHGRSSSIVVSGTNVRRPRGQVRPNEQEPPTYVPSKVVDFELEMALFVGPGNNLGDPVDVKDAENHMFGIVLMNDWSARDVQKWEYQPLGPFCGKNWATTISPWVVTMEALEPFRCSGPKQEPSPLPYLADNTPGAYDIQLKVSIQTEKATHPHLLSQTNLKFMYWSLKQQIAHHTSTGCNLRPGDLLGTGTISGSTTDSVGSLAEITWGGQKPFTITETGEERRYIADGDSIIMEGFCQGPDYKIGFGKCVGKLLPVHTK